LSLRSGH